MSCDDCRKKGALRRDIADRLRAVAQAHGYTLWTRAEGELEIEMLAIPSGPSHGTPQALMEACVGIHRGAPRPPVDPRRVRPQKPRPNPSMHRAARSNDDGMTTYRLNGTAPPVLLTFIDKLSRESST